MKLCFGFLIMYISVLNMVIRVIMVRKNMMIFCLLLCRVVSRKLVWFRYWCSLSMWKICSMCIIWMISRYWVLG